MGSPATGFTVTESAIDISYPDGNFTITFARMPFLSAVMEFLISTIGYGELDDLLRSKLVPEISKRSVSRQANRLSKLLYDYCQSALNIDPLTASNFDPPFFVVTEVVPVVHRRDPRCFV